MGVKPGADCGYDKLLGSLEKDFLLFPETEDPPPFHYPVMGLRCRYPDSYFCDFGTFCKRGTVHQSTINNLPTFITPRSVPSLPARGSPFHLLVRCAFPYLDPPPQLNQVIWRRGSVSKRF